MIRVAGMLLAVIAVVLPLRADAAHPQNYYQADHAESYTQKNVHLYAPGKRYTIKLTNLPDDGPSEFVWVRLEIFESRASKLRKVWTGKERVRFPICRIRLHRYRDGTVFVSALAE